MGATSIRALLALTLLTSACAARAPAPAPPRIATAHIYLPGETVRTPVRYHDVGGLAVFEGDILLGPAAEVETRYGFGPPSADRKHAAATPHRSHLWPGGIIPYVIDASVSPSKRAHIEWAVAHVTSTSILTMRPRTPLDVDYVVFTETGPNNCSAYVGRTGGRQSIFVSQCGRGSLVHEIGHTAGLYHEHSRSDRDRYVSIDWAAIARGHEANFAIRPNSNNLVPYDYASIMHYDRWAFSSNGRETIVPHDQKAAIGQRDGLSAGDRAGLATLYSQGLPPVAALPPWPGLETLGLPELPLPTLPAGLPDLSKLPHLGLENLPAFPFPLAP